MRWNLGPPRGGNTVGSCFPSLFGGTCSGTPAECEDCNKVVTCEEEGPDYDEYNGGEDEVDSGLDMLTNPDGEPCIYLCNDDGGCTVRYAGPPQSGSTVGNYDKHMAWKTFYFFVTFRKLFLFILWWQLQWYSSWLQRLQSGSEVQEEAQGGQWDQARTAGVLWHHLQPHHVSVQAWSSVPEMRPASHPQDHWADQAETAGPSQWPEEEGGQRRGTQPASCSQHERAGWYTNLASWSNAMCNILWCQEWNEELSDISQTWADQCDCIFHKNNVYPCFHEHGGGKERAPLMKPSSGQNLAWQSLPNARYLQCWPQ